MVVMWKETCSQQICQAYYYKIHYTVISKCGYREINPMVHMNSL